MKKLLVIFSLIIFSITLFIGISLFSKKQATPIKSVANPVSYMAEAKPTIYTSPVFGFNMQIPSGYEATSDSSRSASTKNEVFCVTRLIDKMCILSIETVYDEKKPDVSSFIKTPSDYFKKLSLSIVSVGQYEAINWETDSNINYLYMNNGIVLRAHFLSKNSDIVKTVLNTLKFKD